MTTVAWDGKSLAADRLATSGNGVISHVTKLFTLHDGRLFAYSGPCEVGLQIRNWFNSGEDPSAWPESQAKDEFVTAVITNGVVVYEYERFPVPQLVEDPIMAWGSGRLAALGAMRMGASAEQAVRIAAEFDIYTGGGVDVMACGPEKS